MFLSTYATATALNFIGVHSNSTELVKQNGYGHEAVKQSGEALHYAAAELSMDREIILEAVKKDWDASQSVTE